MYVEFLSLYYRVEQAPTAHAALEAAAKRPPALLGRFLELEGFEVQTAANGRQALDTLAAGPPACVIVLDLMMPVMDGWQFRDAQARDPRLSSIPVVVVTAAGSREHVAPIDAHA